jgi:hypothetical protein
METFAEDHNLCNLFHEPLDEKGDITSVGSSSSTIFIQAHHFVLCSAIIHGFTNSDHQHINTIYNQFGPIPRICYDFVKHNPSLLEYEAHFQAALGSLSLKALYYKMISNATMSNLSTVSQMLFLVKRLPEKRLRDMKVDNALKYAYSSVEPITLAVEVAIQNRLWQEKQIDQFKFYSFLASVERTRQMAGLVFKSIGHSRLQERITLDLFPMMKGESGGSESSDQGQWHSTHRRKSMQPEFSIDIQPARVIAYPGPSLETIEPGAYYILESENQNVNSFIMVDDIFYLFRFSTQIASTHPIEPGILSFLSQESLPPKTEWRFVFVVPPKTKISCPQLRDEHAEELLNGMSLFSAVLTRRKPK